MENKHLWKKRLKIALWAVVALFMLSAVWGLVIEPTLLTVTEFSLTDGRLPEDMDGIRVVFITDIHTGSFFPPEDVERLCAKINSLQPDMVLFGGDLLTHEKEVASLDTACVSKAFATLNPRLGKAAILGNHDIQSETMRQSANEILSVGGFTVLDDTAVQIEPGFFVSGTEPWPMPGSYTPPMHSDADKVAWTTDKNAFSLLLVHEPAQFVDASEYHFALTLSGHTHGGQVALPFHGAMILPNGSHVYKAGLYELNGRKMYVSRGIGTSILRLRLFVPPEIVVITLRKK